MTSPFFETVEDKVNESNNVETSTPLIINDTEYSVLALKEENGLNYESILFKGVFDGLDLKLELGNQKGYIVDSQGTPRYCGGFKYKLENDLFDYDKPKMVREYLKGEKRDPNLADSVRAAVIPYFLNNPKFLDRVEEETAEKPLILPLELRKNPEYNPEVAESFAKELHEKYNDSCIEYLQEILPKMILSENDNVLKVFCASLGGILGVSSSYIEAIGSPASGKTYIIQFVLNYLIPKGYVLDFNTITPASFKLLCKNSEKFFERTIINFGDLGDIMDFDRVKPVLNILRVLITDHKYTSVKTELDEDSNWNDLSNIYISADSLVAIYSTVDGDNNNFKNESDTRGQRMSRSISITPTIKEPLKMQRFKDQKDKPGTLVHEEYIEAEKSLERFREWLKMKICEFSKELSDRIPNIFSYIFEQVSSYNEAQIREMERLTDLFTVMTYLNLDRCIEVERKNDKSLFVPCLEDLETFISIMFTGSGFKPLERAVLLKLKEEFSLSTKVHANQITMELLQPHHDCEYSVSDLTVMESEIKDGGIFNTFVRTTKGVEECVIHAASTFPEYPESKIREWNYKQGLLADSKVMGQLYALYGLSEENRKHNKDIVKNNPQQSLDSGFVDRPQVFFTIGQLKRVFKGHEAIRNSKNKLSVMIESFVEQGFVNKLEYKNGRKGNVFTVTPQILKIKDDFEIKENDKIISCAILLHDYRRQLEDDSLKPLCKAYGIRLDDVLKVNAESFEPV